MSRVHPLHRRQFILRTIDVFHLEQGQEDVLAGGDRRVTCRGGALGFSDGRTIVTAHVVKPYHHARSQDSVRRIEGCVRREYLASFLASSKVLQQSAQVDATDRLPSRTGRQGQGVSVVPLRACPLSAIRPTGDGVCGPGCSHRIVQLNRLPGGKIRRGQKVRRLPLIKCIEQSTRVTQQRPGSNVGRVELDSFARQGLGAVELAGVPRGPRLQVFLIRVIPAAAVRPGALPQPGGEQHDGRDAERGCEQNAGPAADPAASRRVQLPWGLDRDPIGR